MNWSRIPICLLLLVLPLSACKKKETPLFSESSRQAEAPVKEVPKDILASQQAFSNVVKAVNPAVVNISTVSKKKLVQPFFEFSPFFDDFFDGRQPKPQYRRENSLGSGFIINKEGYIITNDHVVRDAESIKVKLSNEEEYSGKVVGSDPKTDIAVIKINAKNPLPAAVLGDSSKLQVGQWAIAIGNPFGLDRTVTVGVVSATGRSNMGIETYEDFIQTDASINPGNSGGALLDIEGRLVGVNTAILGDRNAGIGFAIPIDRARRVAEDLVAHGEVREGYVGVSVDDLPAKEGSPIGATGGVVVTSVDQGSPAERAGVRKGDVVESVQGFAVETAEEFRFRVRDLPIGQVAKLELTRGGAKVTASPTAIELTPERVVELVSRRTGLTFSEERVQGGALVVVRKVAPRSPAARIGLQPGDLVREVNSTEVQTLAEFRKAASRARRSGQMVLLVQRGFAAERIPFDLD